MRILLVDDHPLVRKGLSHVLSLENDMEIVAEAGNTNEAVTQFENTQPDLVLVDLMLGKEYGIDFIEKCSASDQLCKFIVLTSSAKHQDFKNAEKAGVNGYVLKDALPEELVYAIRLVYQGRKYYDPDLVELMVNGSKENKPTDSLTDREMEVLIALGRGLCNKDIASKLFITEYTVKKHVSQILEKLDVSDRTQAALFAFSHGLIDNVS